MLGLRSLLYSQGTRFHQLWYALGLRYSDDANANATPTELSLPFPSRLIVSSAAPTRPLSHCTELWALSPQAETAGEGLSGHRVTVSPDGSTQVVVSFWILPVDTPLDDHASSRA